MRIAFAALCAIALAAATTFIVKTEQSITDRRTALRAFDLGAREATDALANIRTAQQAYVAVGQGVAFWTSKVETTTPGIVNGLAALQHSATGAASKSNIDEAIAAFTEFGAVDRRIREYLESDAQLMAADVVFTEGGEAAAKTARLVEQARLEQLVDFDRLEASLRKNEALAAGGAAALGLLTLILLALMPSARKTPTEAAAATLGLSGPRAGSAPELARSDDLPMRREAPAVTTVAAPVAAPPASVDSQRSTAALKAAAELCTDLGRVGDLDELRALLGRAATLLDASGLVLWMGTASGAELRVAEAHGYPAQAVARIPAVLRSADNAAAAAYRTGTLQVVLSRQGSPYKGAVVAPVISADGCIGVLAAEVRDGAEASDTTQALAAIVAAQLGAIVAATPIPAEQRASGGGAL